MEILDRLRRKIINDLYIKEWTEVWFFESWKGVKGYLGTQDIMFVGLNPSLGHFPSKYDTFFYNELKKNGFQNAHLTDFIKSRCSNKKIGDLIKEGRTVKTHLGYLKEEISIIKPKIIVALGGRCYELLYKYINDKRIPIVKIRHYSSIRFIKNKKTFSKEIKKLKNKYRNTYNPRIIKEE